jgi:rubrerythrin
MTDIMNKKIKNDTEEKIIECFGGKNWNASAILMEFPEIMENIESLLSSQEKTPMGVSQWKEYGKKYGYWDYFEKRFTNEMREKIEGMKKLTNDDWVCKICGYEGNECECIGFNKAILSVLSLLDSSAKEEVKK